MRVVAQLLYTSVESPIGELLLLSDGRALCGLHMQEGRKAVRVESGWRRSHEPFVRRQLEEYFAGGRYACLRRSCFSDRSALRRPGGWARERLEPDLRDRALPPPGRCERALVDYVGGLERKRLLLSLEAAAVVSERLYRLPLASLPVTDGQERAAATAAANTTVASRAFARTTEALVEKSCVQPNATVSPIAAVVPNGSATARTRAVGFSVHFYSEGSRLTT